MKSEGMDTFFTSVRTPGEVNALEDRLANAEDTGSKYPGMTYEEGALSMLDFLKGIMEADEVYEP